MVKTSVRHIKPKVFISPGGSGVPNTVRLMVLTEVAGAKGLPVETFDCTQIRNPEIRIKSLLESGVLDGERPILVGSSMGGYVSTVVAEKHEVEGLFLLSPALYVPPYENQAPQPKAKFIVVVHGRQDDIVPPENIRRFARRFGADLHLLPGGHSLDGQLPEIRTLFSRFLDACLQTVS